MYFILHIIISNNLTTAFLTMGGGKGDLKLLKQLAINSIEYSALGVKGGKEGSLGAKGGREELMGMWEGQWRGWVQRTLDALMKGNLE